MLNKVMRLAKILVVLAAAAAGVGSASLLAQGRRTHNHLLARRHRSAFKAT
jgi:hypothetical protein